VDDGAGAVDLALIRVKLDPIDETPPTESPASNNTTDHGVGHFGHSDAETAPSKSKSVANFAL
jgi:hypothetical protein